MPGVIKIDFNVLGFIAKEKPGAVFAPGFFIRL